MTDAQLLDWMARVSAWRKETDERLAKLEQPKRKPAKVWATAAERKVAAAVLDKLNDRAGSKHRHVINGTPTNSCQLIAQLLRKGWTEKDLRLVVWHRCEQWLNEPDMVKYLRPATLFASTKADGYLDEARAAFEAETGDDPDVITADNAPADVINLADRLKA